MMTAGLKSPRFRISAINRPYARWRRFLPHQHKNREIEFPQLVVRGGRSGIVDQHCRDVLKEFLLAPGRHALPSAGAAQGIHIARHAAFNVSHGHVAPEIGNQL